MRRAFFLAVLLTVPVHLVVSGQQPGVNTPVLPGVPADPSDPLALLKSDLVAQRQVEAELMVSTRNPLHLMAAYNDYRAVDIANDHGQPGSIARLTTGRKPAPALARRSQDELRRLAAQDPTAARARAAAEATVGISQSLDGGLTWTGALLPGSLDDPSEASRASAVYGLEAMTDPKTAAAPCGIGYVVFIAFTRGGPNKIAVARYQDVNNSDSENTWEYQGTSVIASGDVATNGNFHDLPAIAVDVPRGPVLDPCQHHVYVGWTTFTGTGGATRLNFAHTIAGSRSWSGRWWNPFWGSRAVSPNGTKTNQAVALAIDPRPGLPFLGGGGTIYFAYRSFNATPNNVFVSTSSDFGLTFSRPVAVASGVPFQSFDQPTLSTDLFPPELLAFRSNALPTIEVVPHPTDARRSLVFTAWAERANVVDCPGPACGTPSAGGDPAIMLSRSLDHGKTWSPRRAVDIGDRDVPGAPDAPPAGFGHLPLSRASGPQVMPKLVFGGGRLGLLYYESRGPLVAAPPTAGLIAGVTQQLDARFALLDRVTGARLGTNQVSRYPIATGANLANGETRDDIADAAPGVKMINERVNHPNSRGGTSPFIGDYIGASPTVKWIFDRGIKRWRAAVSAADVPFQGFRVVFTDSRHQIPPAGASIGEIVSQYPTYSPPGTNAPSCANPGSRNHDVMHALIDSRIAVNAATTFKQLGVIQRAFPVMVSNGAATRKFFRLRFDRPAIASFAQTTDADVLDLELLPYSSSTKTVYVTSSVTTDAVTVIVAETTGLPSTPGGDVELVPGGLTGQITLNLDPSNQQFEGDEDTETHTPLVSNPLVSNPLVSNAGAQSSTARSPLVSNPLVSNPLVSNDALGEQTVYRTTHMTWEVRNQGNVSSAYVTQVSVPNAEALLNGSYVFHLLVHKRADRAGLDGCETVNVGQDQIISTIPSPLVSNPLVSNPLVSNPLVSNPLVSNATFFAAPSDAGSSSSLLAARSFGGAQPPTSVTSDRRSDVVYVTLIANQIRPDTDPLLVRFDPVASPPAIAVIPQSADIIDGVLQNGGEPEIRFVAPDLVIGGTLATPLSAVPVGSTVLLTGAAIANAGNQIASAPGGFEYGVYLSTDNVIDRGDRLLTTIDGLGPLAPGASLASEIRVVIPKDVLPGSYFVGLLADNGGTGVIGDVAEGSEFNNFAAVPLGVLPGDETGLQIRDEKLPPVAIDAGTPYRYPLQAIGGVGALTWSLTSDPACQTDCPIPPLPAGLSLDAQSGVISGALTEPRAEGEAWSVYYRVRDSSPVPQVDVQRLAISAAALTESIVFVQSPSAPVAPNQPFTVTVQLSGTTPLAGQTIELALHYNAGAPGTSLEPRPLTAVTNSDGLATFTVFVDAPGEGYTLSATYATGTEPLRGAVSRPFAVR